ncbi:MAG TPA: DUF3037 domain-containing protein [Candidatus Acidoferrum sp.]|nr:DUF3037 domain-containing protein [Candidatus Acidoferrum sp.]
MKSENEITQRAVAGLLSAGTQQQVVRVFLVRYVPHALKDESVNIAVLMIGDGFANARFVDDWQHILAFDPGADIELLIALTCELRDKLRIPGQLEEMLHRMQHSWANTVQLSLHKACLTEDPATEIETLASQYL